MLLNSYLHGRFQFVDFNSTSSSLLPMDIGVPQSRILGPLLYILYLNDIFRASEFFDFILYADDTTLLSTPAIFKMNNSQGVTTVNLELNKIYTWLSENRLSLNVSKTNCMIFCNHSKLSSKLCRPKLFINGIEVEYVAKFNFLGILIDETLSWKCHVAYIHKKILSVSGILNKMKYCLPVYVKRYIYSALVNCHLNYGILLWGHASQSQLNLLLKDQKRAVRHIFV